MRGKAKDALHRNRELLRKIGLLGDPPKEDDGSMYDPLVELANSDSYLEKVESKLHEAAFVQVGLELAMDEMDDENELLILSGLHELSDVAVEACIAEYRKAYAKVDPDSHLYIDELIKEILNEAQEDALADREKLKPKKPPSHE